MRKLIGTIVIFAIFYIGFFGYKKYNIKPFITEWLSSDKPKNISNKIDNIRNKIDSISYPNIKDTLK